MEKIKVVEIVEAMLGGIRQHVCDIVEKLDRNTYDVYLIYSDNRADAVFFNEIIKFQANTTLIICNHMHRELGCDDILAYRLIKRALQKINPDIVHCHSSKAGIIGRLAAKSLGVSKIYYTPNAYSFQSPDISKGKKILYTIAEKILSKYCTTKTINVSEGEKKLALECKLDKCDKFKLIYNGIADEKLVDKSEIRKQLGFNNDHYLVGITARCAKQKDPFIWLEIAKKVINIRGDVEFVYIGDGELFDSMNKWVTSEKLENNIRLLGYRSDASYIVRMFDIYLSTALYEGLPYSMIEAMRAGVPIIATDVVGNNEIVEENLNGYLFHVGDVLNGAEKIIQQIELSQITENMVKTLFINKFSLKNMIKELEKVYYFEKLIQ